MVGTISPGENMVQSTRVDNVVDWGCILGVAQTMQSETLMAKWRYIQGSKLETHIQDRPNILLQIRILKIDLTERKSR